MTATDGLLANAAAYEAAFDASNLPLPPALKLAVVTCMDARVNLYALLGLRDGDAHLIRNAGGVVTDEEIRSLAISQRLGGTKEIILIHHTDCGLLTITDEEFAQRLEDDTGERPTWSAHAFGELEDAVRAAIAKVKASPFLPHRDNVRGFVYDVHTGALSEVSPG